MVSNNFPKGTEVDLKIPMLPDMELAAAKTAEAMAEYAHFSEDEIDLTTYSELKSQIIAVQSQISQLLDSSVLGKNIFSGIRIIIYGFTDSFTVKTII